ncbi:MAG: DUF4197 domain-containing protein [Bacteroidales bacterium]|nr:DUF4197 domain-containing protein [Bacteroidales bacterium]MCF8457132.1 DUF4197 domain-containing protein [Bacteroidales bacterium]
MRKILYLIPALMLLVFVSCQELADILYNGLTETEIVEGLKSALTVGTDTSVTTVSKKDGYYKDALIKILLPPEAAIIQEYVSLIPGGDGMLETVVESLNRAAEDAATEAKPIFISAITGMTIADGVDILYGEDTSATHYLRKTTYDQLFNLFQPKIATSLDKKLVGEISTNDSWEAVTTAYNTYVVNTIGLVTGLQPINTTLDDYATRKGLDGLFIKVKDEEKDIRLDPLARVTDILAKVFGTLDE